MVKTRSSEHTLRDQFFDSGQKKDFANFNELLKKENIRKHRSPTAICLFEVANPMKFDRQRSERSSRLQRVPQVL